MGKTTYTPYSTSNDPISSCILSSPFPFPFPFLLLTVPYSPFQGGCEAEDASQADSQLGIIRPPRLSQWCSYYSVPFVPYSSKTTLGTVDAGPCGTCPPSISGRPLPDRILQRPLLVNSRAYNCAAYQSCAACIFTIFKYLVAQGHAWDGMGRGVARSWVSLFLLCNSAPQSIHQP